MGEIVLKKGGQGSSRLVRLWLDWSEDNLLIWSESSNISSKVRPLVAVLVALDSILKGILKR